MKSQNERLLGMLRHRSVTPMVALENLGIFRLAARIDDLRKAGHPIESQMVVVCGHRVSEYSMVSV